MTNRVEPHDTATGGAFPPLDPVAKAEAFALLDYQVSALRALDPTSGAYVNEVSRTVVSNEPRLPRPVSSGISNLLTDIRLFPRPTPTSPTSSKPSGATTTRAC